MPFSSFKFPNRLRFLPSRVRYLLPANQSSRTENLSADALRAAQKMNGKHHSGTQSRRFVFFRCVFHIVMQRADADSLLNCLYSKPRRFEFVENAFFKTPVGMRKMIFLDIFHAHHDATPETQNRPRRVLRVVGRRVPIAADDGRQIRQSFQMIENDFHLQMAMFARTMRVEMNADGAKFARRMFDIGDQARADNRAVFLCPTFCLCRSAARPRATFLSGNFENIASP